MKKTFVAAAIAIAATIAMTATAFALSATMGNEATNRGTADSYSNFTIVDTNNPAAFDGTISSIEFYAHRGGTVRFLTVDTDDTVIDVTEEYTATSAGLQTFALAEPLGVTAGSNLAVYSKAGGVVSWQYAGTDPAMWEPSGSGLPAVGDTLDYESAAGSARIYSMNAIVRAASPDLCKNGGWENYPEYKNQGQCIASIVANENAGK